MPLAQIYEMVLQPAVFLCVRIGYRGEWNKQDFRENTAEHLSSFLRSSYSICPMRGYLCNSLVAPGNGVKGVQHLSSRPKFLRAVDQYVCVWQPRRHP